ncbi:metallophosphoesterase family protein [Nitrospirillum viridazoti]|uniref:Metallophosphoesterase n=1 Tax=Nitrospirillum viridazoti CBAmc TaxID=1441467 RepID=A0A248JW26_9PROT|nr:metallophosphoesterase [Nitrospirillum amazonense]ASG22691.1 metallophosphoesterase [Nitrospirillum amazonense CBAmc]TWB30207.1 calcineurin-like phosphoesterase family protein [Nitrospirillum amazonense]
MAHQPSLPADEIDTGRRHALRCMAWAGTGLVWSVAGGVPLTAGLIGGGAQAAPVHPGLTFAQISDSHVGFDKPANPDALATLREAVSGVRSLPTKPAFVIHTGDISHLSRDEQFDAADQALKELGVPVFFVPGEHDVLDDGMGAAYLARYGKGPNGKALGAGWYSFDHGGVHFVALVNVVNLKGGGLGNLGEDQLAWLADDLRALSASTPVVVFAHIPLWTVYPEWGWGTDDGARALSLLARFGSVTVLNGHIHQILQKVEGNVAFHTARSTAFPQPSPGSAPSPGPMKLPADKLRGALGVTTVTYRAKAGPLAVVDATLG